MHADFWWGFLREEHNLEDLGVDGRITSRIYLQEVGWRDMEWIDLAQDGNRWWKFVNEGNGHFGSTKCGEFLD